MDTNERGERELAAVGRVGDYEIQVLREMTSRGVDYVFRAVLDNKIVYESSQRRDTLESAITAGIIWANGGEEQSPQREPDASDLEALGLMLFGLGDDQTIDSLDEARKMYKLLSHAAEILPEARASMVNDFAAIASMAARMYGPMSDEFKRIGELRDVCLASHDISTKLAVRDAETLGVFLSQYS